MMREVAQMPQAPSNRTAARRREATGTAAACACLTGVLLIAGCATGPKQPLLTQQQRELNVESFDCVWSKIHEEYWDPELGGLDWPAVRDELRPQIEQAATTSAARAVLRDMISRLGISHFGIFPAEIYEKLDQPGNEEPSDGSTGIHLRVLDGHAIVTSVVPDSPADQLAVRPGWEILRINEFDVVSRLEELAGELEDTPNKRVRLAYAIIPRSMGRVGDTVAVTFRDGQDQNVELEIPLAEARGQARQFGNLGLIRVRIDVQTLDDNIGYIAFSGFFNPPYVMTTFNEAMRSFVDADGLIIDLRGNAGGMGGMAMGMAGWLVAQDRQLGTLRMRGTELKLLVHPRPKAYTGPLVVLVDGHSGSASEFFAGGLQEMGRACIVGSRTKGDVLPGQFTTLPNGDVFLYATASFVSAGGKTLEGVGVIPDIEVHPTRQALLEGRDLALEAAVAWIRKQR
jgi:carboxyl-terminal processing protease